MASLPTSSASPGRTLLLHNLPRAPRSVQARLVPFVSRVKAGESTAQTEHRIITTTDRELESLVRSGVLREDFYVRLSALRVCVPPLRTRRQDIAPLAYHFLARAFRRIGRPMGWIASPAMDLMRRYDWPGNVAELERTIESAALLCRGVMLQPCDLPARVHTLEPKPRRSGTIPAVGFDLRAEVESYENALIRQALERTGGNKNQAARLLGINRTTLVEMLKRKRIQAA